MSHFDFVFVLYMDLNLEKNVFLAENWIQNSVKKKDDASCLKRLEFVHFYGLQSFGGSVEHIFPTKKACLGCSCNPD